MNAKRGFDALCYLATGLAVIAATIWTGAGMSTGMTVSMWAVGLALSCYGAKIAVTRSNYWVHPGIYMLPVFAVIVLIFVVTRG